MDSTEIRAAAPFLEESAGTAFAPADQPLTDAERVLADRVAQRLCLELRGLVRLLPEQDRSASAMARALGVDRNTCQRIVAATLRGDANARTLVQLPGVRGLRQFIGALERRTGDEAGRDLLASAGAAVDHFELLIEHLAGSQRRLRERIEADVRLGDSGAPGPSDDLKVRRALFQAAVAATGRWSETWLSTSIIRPLPSDPLMTEVLKVRGHIGHISRPAAVPLEIGESAAANLVGTPGDAGYAPLAPGVDDAGRFLLKPFCTTPLPRVTSRAMGTRLIHVIEGSETAQGEPADIVLGEYRARADLHPATQRPALGEVWSLITFPARRLLFDVHLHRDIASRCTPSLELHLWGPHSGDQGLWRWSTRFPGGPKLQRIGPAADRSAAGAYSRHAELTGHAFLHAGWNPGEFVGFRCDVAYPVWRAGYCMLFDFTGNELPERAPRAGGMRA